MHMIEPIMGMGRYSCLRLPWKLKNGDALVTSHRLYIEPVANAG